jgi:hypothetical protein
MSETYGGLHRAQVVQNDDPAQRFRLLVSAPVMGVTPAWAEACISSTPCVVPDAGDTVWILFEAGRPERPVWLGSLPGSAA